MSLVLDALCLIFARVKKLYVLRAFHVLHRDEQSVSQQCVAPSATELCLIDCVTCKVALHEHDFCKEFDESGAVALS